MKKCLLLLLLTTSMSCNTDDVYICTGPRSRVYHKTDNCKGLRRCSGTIKKVDVAYAKKIGRRECRICY